MKYEDFSDLSNTGFSVKETKKPEDEFFHSIYIAGKTRTNHIGVSEEANKLQIRGFKYNLDEVNMIITHIKEVLVKTVKENGQDRVGCFSYKTGKVWKGTSGNICGRNSAERAASPFCKDCKSNLIVAGMICSPNGKPLIDENNKAVFGFIRGKGMKYSNISEYLTSLFRLDLEPLILPSTEETMKLEKSIINHKRFVTKITIGWKPSRYGDKTVFDLAMGIQIPDDYVKQIVKKAKEILPQFNEKFDWSQTLGKEQEATDQIKFEDNKPKEEEKTMEEVTGESFSLDDIVF